LAADFKALGGEVLTNCKVVSLMPDSQGFNVITTKTSFHTNQLVGCAGLYSDLVAHMCGIQTSVAIIPFRGEYYYLKPEARHYCHNLIYPVPDPSLPFLGVHLTRTIGGSVECGPNAVLAWAREGYSHSKINVNEFGGLV
jgi:L-2-hydroxyglutarate oxidase